MHALIIDRSKETCCMNTFLSTSGNLLNNAKEIAGLEDEFRMNSKLALVPKIHAVP